MLGLKYLIKIKQKYNLIDISQKQNPNKRSFTYLNKSQSIHSRIDRIYLPQNQKIENVSIIPINLSDHDVVTLTIKI